MSNELSRNDVDRLEHEMRTERRRDYREAMAEFFASDRGAEILDKVVAKIAEKQMARIGRWTITSIALSVGAIVLYVAWVINHGNKP